MADGAVLTHDVFVLERDTRAGTIVFGDIGPADQINDLIGLNRTGARIHRIGPDARKVIHLERRDGAVPPDADFSLATTVARMDVGVEALDPVSNEFDRPP